MAQGIVTNSTKQRIEELERKLNELNEKIVVERTKEKIQVSREEVMKFIRTSLKKDCKQMLKSLIKEIVLYNDKIEIVYNYVDTKRIKLEDEHKPETFYTEKFETDIDEHRFKQNPKKLHFDIDAKV